MNRLQRGFTLIELMITIAIIGILASVAMPAYQDYAVRSKMSEVILALSTCRGMVTEVYQSSTSAPGAGSWGCETAATSKYVGSITTSADGMIVATVQNISGVTGKLLTLTPLAAADTPADASVNIGNGLFGWRCGAGSDGTNVEVKYLPSSCR